MEAPGGIWFALSCVGPCGQLHRSLASPHSPLVSSSLSPPSPSQISHGSLAQMQMVTDSNAVFWQEVKRNLINQIENVKKKRERGRRGGMGMQSKGQPTNSWGSEEEKGQVRTPIKVSNVLFASLGSHQKVIYVNRGGGGTALGERSGDLTPYYS